MHRTAFKSHPIQESQISTVVIKTAIDGSSIAIGGGELIPPKKSLRSEPADFQRGEVEVDGINLYYNAWETKTEVDRS